MPNCVYKYSVHRNHFSPCASRLLQARASRLLQARASRLLQARASRLLQAH